MRWFLYAPLQLLIMIICYITNPIVVLFSDENGELHGFLRKWQTFDDSCDSEGSAKQIKTGGKPPSFLFASNILQ